MPGGSGLQLLEAKCVMQPGLPVIIMTAYSIWIVPSGLPAWRV